MAYWRDGLRVLNYATKVEVRALPLVVQLLSDLDRWRTVDDVGKRLGLAAERQTVAALMDRLAGASILQRSDHAPDPKDRAMAEWSSWNPAVGYFHAMTTSVAYVEDGLPSKAARRAWPSDRPTVRRRGVEIALDRPDASDAFSRVLTSRRTWRRFSRASIDKDKVATLLWMTSGVQAWLHTPRGEKLEMKTSPSGGARHPIDVYVLARHVRGLASGLYRYDGIRHALVSIGPAAQRNRAYLPRQYWYDDAALLVFFCAGFEKTRKRYAYPRAYRAVLIEAGHVCQTFCLTATALGLAPFSTLALDDGRIEADLGIDGISHAVVYAAGVGTPAAHGVPSAPHGVADIDIRTRSSRAWRLDRP